MRSRERVVSNTTNGALLQVDNLSKRFGGLSALSEVSFSVQSGSIFGLIGPNGAGKTTLFNVLTGLYPHNGGTFSLLGHPCQNLTPDRIAALGIARTFQNIRLFANLSALENVMIGRHVRTRAGVWGAMIRDEATRLEEADIVRRARELLRFVGLEDKAHTLAKHFSYGDQRRVEIARALATDPKILALDEPAAGMNATEKLALRALLTSIRAQGITILLVEHDVKLVMNLCDHIVVLDYGKKIAEGTPTEVQKNSSVIQAYLGTPLTHPAEPSL